VTVTAPAVIAIVASTTSTPCGANTGTATATTTGGTGAYTYVWSPSGQTTSTATGLASGTYTVTVNDANSCTQTQTFTVLSGLPPVLTTSQNNLVCYDQCIGNAFAAVSGGSAPYTYSWSNGQTTATITNICAGTYTCMVTDFYGCADTQSVTITQPTAININTSIVACTDGLANAQAIANVSGGQPSYSYLWNSSPLQFTSTATNLTPGAYTILVTDFNSCIDSAQVIINECPLDSIHVPNVFTPNSDGKNDQFFIFTEGYATLHCEIYNRWGEKMYEWNTISGSWNGTKDGTPAVDGIYYYIYNATKIAGGTSTGEGFLQLIRN
jgi:gliding motility-associated-like protein